MAHSTQQTGDSRNGKPGTCNQTGNTAPKFPWAHTPIGRVARIAALCCAYKLGYDDDRMGKAREFPPDSELNKLFLSLMPWFPKLYNDVRASKAAEKNYEGPLEEYGPSDVANRVHYCFAVPGRRGHDPKARLYGISVEHPSSTSSSKPGGRREVFARCSVEIMRRLDLRKSISKVEAEEWGKK